MLIFVFADWMVVVLALALVLTLGPGMRSMGIVLSAQ